MYESPAKCYKKQVLSATISMTVIYALELDMLCVALLFVLIAVICCISAVKLHIGLCPYCESFMGRGILFRSHCPRCRGRLTK